MSRFSESLLEHARYPQNCRRDPDADFTGRADWNGQPPVLEIFLRVRDAIVTQASFCASGCGVAIGVGSALTDFVKGKSLEAVTKITLADLLSAVDGIPEDRIFCAIVAIGALKNALNDASD